MKISRFVWFDKMFLDNTDKIDVPISSQGLNYGFGVFDGIRARSVGQRIIIFRLTDHIQRFYYSARKLLYPLDRVVSMKEMVNACKLLIAKNQMGDVYIRPLLYFGSAKTPFEKLSKSNMHVAIFTFSLPYPFKNPIRVGIAEKKKDTSSLIVDIKSSGQYQVFAFEREKARQKGLDDALYLDDSGNIAETVGSNIFLVKNKKIYTPTLNNILGGVTRNSIIKIAPDLGYTVIETSIPYSALGEFDEVFFTGTAVGIIAAKKVGSYEFSRTETSKQLEDYYTRITYGEIAKYSKWLTIIEPSH